MAPAPTLSVPRVPRPPTLEDFLEMEPNGDLEGKLAKVEGFIQREPSDGQPATQRTEVYFGYDDKNFYVVFVCFDGQPERIRARLTPRENFFGDDAVEVMFDTFHDQRRAYAFLANPFGIQFDALWTEGRPEVGGGQSRGPRGFDGSFDTLWHSRGQLTDRGYVVWMAIPFKSLRFPDRAEQTWGILFNRDIPRLNEEAWWPQYSTRIEGRLNQAATLRGLENISPGRNLQLIPFGVIRSARSLDARDPLRPRFDRDPAEPDAGLDAKLVFQDSLVLDVALNPDFSQVESDEPQVTTNQRFEVFFPEKRAFFIENASYFETPINLVFTRRIADPQFGVRLTGKRGPWALGAFAIDDEAPGKSVPRGDPLAGRRAVFTILRVNRDLGRQSSLGFLFTDREFDRSHNRIGGVDGRVKLSENWVAAFQAVSSSTRCLPEAVFDRLAAGVRQRIDGCRDGESGRQAGPGYDVEVNRSGRQFNYKFEYNDRAVGFRSAPGFIFRSDIRRYQSRISYAFRPEGRYLISWGPTSSTEAVFDHSGTRLDLTQDTSLSWQLVGQTELRVLYFWDRERLRPVDFPALAENRDFARHRSGVSFRSTYLSPVSVEGSYHWGTRINFVPPDGQAPFLANLTNADWGLTLRPLTPLRIENTYLFFRLQDRASDALVLANHILRSKWNYQFTRELSLRVILQYDATLANPAFTALSTRKNVNADFLLTYLVHPGTVLYVGYNGNAQNVFLCEGPGVAGAGCADLPAGQAELIRRRRQFIHDAGQFFVKFSYLLRF